MSKENLNIDRINELARKKKEHGLTNEEAKEQTKLRRQYLEEFRKGFKQQIENTKVIDPEGNDVTINKTIELDPSLIYKLKIFVVIDDLLRNNLFLINF